MLSKRHTDAVVQGLAAPPRLGRGARWSPMTTVPRQRGHPVCVKGRQRETYRAHPSGRGERQWAEQRMQIKGPTSTWRGVALEQQEHAHEGLDYGTA